MFDTLTLVFWHWWIAAVVFLILEMIVPAALFLWMGVSAIIVGLISLMLSEFAVTLGPEIEILLFSILSILTILGWRFYRKENPTKDPIPELNQRGAQYIGRELILTAPITSGFGREKVGSSYWSLKGQDAPAGSKVRITGHDGTTLVVETIKPDSGDE